MKEYSYLVGKFAFQTPTQIEEAKKEEEAIAYIRENTEISNAKHALSLYMKLNDKPSFHTEIGLEFMRELYDVIAASGMVEKENIPAIKVDLGNPFKISPIPDGKECKRDTTVEKKLMHMQNKHRNLWIVNLFLIGVILVMFYFARTSDYSVIADYETKIIDKYASWEEELTKREQAVIEKEAQER